MSRRVSALSVVAIVTLGGCNSSPNPASSSGAEQTTVADAGGETPPASTGEAPHDGTTTGGTPEPIDPDPDPFDPGPGPPADPLTAEQIDAAIPTEQPPLEFWKQGDAACAAGHRLDGALPPDGKEIRCVDAEGRWTGMEARFFEGLPLRVQSIGLKQDNRNQGVWLWFHKTGEKSAEHTYHQGQLHGTVRRWAPNGQEIESTEYRAGRAWGLSVHRDETGKELSRSQLERGTGVLVSASASGRTESDYVNGLLHGTHRRFDAQGQLREQSAWSGGEWHGPQSLWDEGGQQIGAAQYKQGKQHGVATRWANGQITEQSIWVDGDQRSRQLYRDGQPLVPLPLATDCETDSGLSTMLATARGRGLPDEHACVTRMALFPGVIMLADFAYDAGCRGADFVVDCKLVDPDPTAAELLARAGWSGATPDQRLEIAKEYIREFGLHNTGSISWNPEEPVWKSLADGGVEGVLWLVAPSGMRRGQELDKVRLTFAVDGSLKRDQLEHRSTGQD